MTITLDNTTAGTNVILCRLACSRMYFPLKIQLLPETIRSSGYCLCKLKYSSISLILEAFKPLKEKYLGMVYNTENKSLVTKNFVKYIKNSISD